MKENPLRGHLFTGNPMSRYEFALRLLGGASKGGTYTAGTMIFANALLSSMPIEALIRLGAVPTAHERRLYRILRRRQRGQFTAKDKDGSGPWPFHAGDVRDFLAREQVKYVTEIRDGLMAQRLMAGFPDHEYMYVRSASESAEIAAPYTLPVLEREFTHALKVMGDLYPESHAYYCQELSEVGKLSSFLRWKITPEGRRIDDPLTDLQAVLLLYMDSPVRIEAGDAMRWLDRLTDDYIAGKGL